MIFFNYDQLNEMLQKNGVEVLRQWGINAEKFLDTKTDYIVTVAGKK